jgi:tetratricopeptide (TPR) repeat protein
MSTVANPPDAAELGALLTEGYRLLDDDPSAAAERARTVLAAIPNQPDANRLLGAALRRLGDDVAANAAELAAIAVSRNDPDLVRAANALAADDLDTAEPIVRRVLQARPYDPVAIQMLGEIAASAGIYRDAERFQRKALELAPGYDFARLHLALALDMQNRCGEALAELDRLGPKMAAQDEVKELRATVLGRVGGYEEAIAINRERLAATPDDPLILMSLAYLLHTVGEQDEAIAIYRRVLELDPARAEAWWRLANLKTFRFTDKDVAAMERALQAPDAGPTNRLHLHFALAKAAEDRGDDGRSFSEYQQANAIRAAEVRHDPANVTTYVDQAVKLFTAEFFAERVGGGCPATDPIFIVGLPRAGSTLVEQILASHPLIEGTAELGDLIVLARSLEPDERLAAQGIWHHYPHVLAELRRDEFERLGERYLELTRVQRKTDRPHFTDKMPINWAHVGFIKLILPNARIVDVRRHPLAGGFSAFKHHFARGQEFSYDLAHIGSYYANYVRLMRHFDDVLPGAVHRVIHERLVEDPEREVRRLLDYVGVPFDEACLRFYESDRPVRTPSSEQVRRPIDATATGQWRRFEAQLAPLKEALGPALERWED